MMLPTYVGEKKRKVKRKEEEGCFRYFFSVLILKGLGFGLILLFIKYINTFFFFFMFILKLTTSSHDVPSNILKH